MLSNLQIENYQFKKLKMLINYAYNKVRYYHELFNKAGISPDSIKSKNDIQKIPITSREEMRNLNLYYRIGNGIDIKKCIKLHTSGSSGIPLDIYATRGEILKFKTLPFLVIFFENGCRITDKILRVTHPYFVSRPYWFQHLNILREYFITLDSDMDEQLTKFIQIRPQVIRGFTSAIKSLALKIKEKGIKITPPKIIFTTAEVLTEIDRELISSIFQAEVIDYYCCNEFGIIAWECNKHSGYHINSDNAIIDFIKEGKPCRPGEEGEIVITSLNNYAMPFIRYRIGDIGVREETICSCGNNSPLIKAIIGRNNDQIILSHERIVSPYLLFSLFTHIQGVMEFQIIQEDVDKVTINVVKENIFSDDLIINRIKSECQNLLGDKIKIKVMIVKYIPKEKTGKFKVVRNEISSFRPHIFQ